MKTSTRNIILIVVVIFTTSLISWIRFTNPEKKVTTDKNPQQVNENELYALLDEPDWLPYRSVQTGKVPSAEDVLIQKVPGDKSHVLMMAFYSKENYTGQFVTLGYSDENLVFRDDGRGDDKIAGDGLFTAKIAADANDFRQTALGISQQMKMPGQKSIRFVHRVMTDDPDDVDDFDLKSFDANKPVSIAAVINFEGAGSSTLDLIMTHSLAITNLAVVEDPTRTWNPCAQKGNVNGPWTFKTIMKQLASTSPSQIATDAQTSAFVLHLFNQWTSNQIVNSDTVKARDEMTGKILTPWLNKSKSGGSPKGQLDMKFAPFKLLAIMNRFDLRAGQVNGIPTAPAGEGRFVFTALTGNCANPINFLIILEYGINVPNTCAGIKAMAQQWYNLKDLAVGSSQYNAALQVITDKYSKCGSNPSKPNQSSLDQLRSNDIALSPSPNRWELREFVISGSTHFLEEHTVAQTPKHKYNVQVNNADVARMVDYIRVNATAIKAETNEVPLLWQGVPFLGAVDHIDGPPTGNPKVGQPPSPYHWDGTEDGSGPTHITGDATRGKFSFNTCSGCHSGETQTSFTHVDPVFFGTEATLSGFITGRAGKGGAVDFDGDPNNSLMSVKDPALRPVGNPQIRTFNEFTRRGTGLKKVAEAPCGSILSISQELMFQPLNSPD